MWMVSLMPCRDCTSETGRKAYCHSDCKKYIEFKKVDVLRKQSIEEERDYKSYLTDKQRGKWRI